MYIYACSLKDYGDPYPQIHTEIPDESNYVMRVCVVEMASEYCKYAEGEMYCNLIEMCDKKDMTPEVEKITL
jgi:hypothetical protein